MQDKGVDKKLILRLIKTLIYCRVASLQFSIIKIARFLMAIQFKDQVLNQVYSLKTLESSLKILQKKGKVVFYNGAYLWRLKAEKKLFDSQKKTKKIFFDLKKVSYLTQQEALFLKLKRALKQNNNRKLFLIKATEQQKIVVQKIKQAIFYVKILRFLPGIQYLGISGTLASGNANFTSDIDLLIVTSRKRIWTTRFFLVVILELLNKRRKKNQSNNCFCLNYFLTEDNLAIQKQDLYSALELGFLITLINRKNIFERLREQNGWVNRFLPQLDFNSQNYMVNYWEGLLKNQTVEKLIGLLNRCFQFFCFDYLERFLGFWQAKRIKKKFLRWPFGQIKWSNRALIFHPQPKSVSFKKNYITLIKEEGFKELEKDGLL